MATQLTRTGYFRRHGTVATQPQGCTVGISCVSPNGASNIFADCTSLIGKSSSHGRDLADHEAIALALLKEVNVVAGVQGRDVWSR